MGRQRVGFDMRSWRVAVLAAGLVCVVAAFAWSPLARVLTARAVLSDLAAAEPATAPGLAEQDVGVPGRDGPIRARIYRRADTPRGPGIVIAHGVHYLGIDEPRLVKFARALARAGKVVLTPELADLADYRITPTGVGVIEDSVEYLGARSWVTSPRVGLIGFSFAGGQSLLAAASPELQGHVAFVTSVGGYDDLARVLRFLATDAIETPEGVVHAQAHEYGLVVLIYDDLAELVPPADVAPLRAALRAWLHEDFASARALATARRTLEGEQLFERVEQHRLREIAPRLLQLVDARRAELAALSPRGRLGDIGAPVYLLHGAGDSVIPPSEARWADRELGSRETHNADHAAPVPRVGRGQARSRGPARAARVHLAHDLRCPLALWARKGQDG